MPKLPASASQTESCVQLDMEGLYEREGSAPVQHLQSALTNEEKKAGAHASGDSLAGVVWTPSMRRMYTLLDRCLYILAPRPLDTSADLVLRLLPAQRALAFMQCQLGCRGRALVLLRI